MNATLMFRVVCYASVVVILAVLPAVTAGDNDKLKRQLSDQHIAAMNRTRRIVINFDVISGNRSFGGRVPDELVKWKFDFIDDARSQVDSVWWCWGEGHQAPWPSRTMILYDDPGYRKWVEEGVDIVRVFLEAAKKRKLESFYNYRINGGDNDLGAYRKIPIKEAHPDWLIQPGFDSNPRWNFAIQGVRDYKLGILREIAERYDDLDGIAIDFARATPVLPKGAQWENRCHLNDFMRTVRQMTLEVAAKRGRPLLLGVRIPENLEGCHFDGIDIETWVREQLVDILALGVRSFDVDVAVFRRLVAGSAIKLYPCVDDHHASDGYAMPPIRIYRGVAANWWHQGADGIMTFNFNHAMGSPFGGGATHRQAYCELGSPGPLTLQDKVFVVQRRGGGHGPTVSPNPEDWRTPRWNYFNTNMFAPLPVQLARDGQADTLLRVYVGDDLAANTDRIHGVRVHLLLSDPAAARLPATQRLGEVTIATIGHPGGHLVNIPPAKDIGERLELRLNNILLSHPTTAGGWLEFKVRPILFAQGNNLIGLRVVERNADAAITVEKFEVHVDYH